MKPLYFVVEQSLNYRLKVVSVEIKTDGDYAFTADSLALFSP